MLKPQHCASAWILALRSAFFPTHCILVTLLLEYKTTENSLQTPQPNDIKGNADWVKLMIRLSRLGFKVLAGEMVHRSPPCPESCRQLPRPRSSPGWRAR